MLQSPELMKLLYPGVGEAELEAREKAVQQAHGYSADALPTDLDKEILEAEAAADYPSMEQILRDYMDDWYAAGLLAEATAKGGAVDRKAIYESARNSYKSEPSGPVKEPVKEPVKAVEAVKRTK